MASTSISKWETKVFNYLSYLACFRGIDSAGMVAVGRSGSRFESKVLKSDWNPVSMIESQGYAKIIEDRNVALLGHSRAATHGDINAANAHPYTFGSITGMHNGMVPDLLVKDSKKTDSWFLIKKIKEEGIDFLSDLKGAFAISWLDETTNKVYFVRNDQRPLAYMKGGANLLVWASEPIMLEFLKARMVEFKNSTVILMDTDMLYSFTLGTINMSCRPLKETTTNPFVESHKETKEYLALTPPPSTKPIVGRRYPSPTSITPITIYSNKYPYTPEIQQERKKNVEPRHIPTQSISDLYVYKGYANNLSSIKKAEELLNKGCCMCSSVEEVAAEVTWMNHKEYLCTECSSDSGIQQLTANDRVYKSALVRKAL